MALDTANDWKGLLDIINISILLTQIDSAGLNHKVSVIDEPKRLVLIEIGKKILLNKIPESTGLESYLTTPIVSTLDSHIDSFNLSQLENFRDKFDDENVKALKSNLDSYLASPTTLNLISKTSATTISTITEANNVLANLTDISILELVNPTTSIKFLYDNSFLDQTTYDSILKNLKGTELTKLIAGLPALSYISGITGLDETTIATFINPINLNSNKCICNIFGNFSGLEAGINNFFDSIIPSIDLTQLNALKLQFDLKIASLQSEVDLHLNNLLQIDNLIQSIETAIASLPTTDANCTQKLVDMLNMIKSIKTLYNTLIVLPVMSQFNMLKSQVNNIVGFANLINDSLNFKVDLSC